MPVGESGRIVIEVYPRLKEDLYARLKKDGMNLKEWFLGQANSYLDEQIKITFDKSTKTTTGDLFE